MLQVFSKIKSFIEFSFYIKFLFGLVTLSLFEKAGIQTSEMCTIIIVGNCCCVLSLVHKNYGNGVTVREQKLS